MLYFDNAATTRPFQEALDAYVEVAQSEFGNPSSRHVLGYQASRILEDSREKILHLLAVEKTHRLVFTSGATESNNLALKGTAFSYQNRGKKILVSPMEHPSVKNVLSQLKEKFGFEVETLKVNASGVLDLDDLKSKMDSSVILVSVMAVNNETGSIQPMNEIARIVKAYPKAFFHCDAAQAMGKLPLDWSKPDLISFSAHKFGGLKGNGGLLYKKTMRLLPLNNGGEQENNLRAGTVDVPGIKAMEVALKKSYEAMKTNLEKEKHLVSLLREGLSKIDEVVIHSPLDASPYVFDFSLTSHKASVVVEALSNEGICVSSVSACSSKGEPHSYVLEAMGKNERECANPIRVSFPVDAKEEDVERFLAALKTVLKETHPL